MTRQTHTRAHKKQQPVLRIFKSLCLFDLLKEIIKFVQF